MENEFEKQTTAIEEHRDKQTEVIENQTKAMKSQRYEDLGEKRFVDKNKNIDEDEDKTELELDRFKLSCLKGKTGQDLDLRKETKELIDLKSQII